MKITLKETLTLDIFSNFKLVAGKKGLKRCVSRIGLLDHEMINPIKGQFAEGEFALSTLLAAKDHPELIYSSVAYLIESKASGLGVKDIYFSQLPDDVLALAEASDFPIFIFDNSVYFEDIITEFKSFIDKLNYESTMNKSLERLLRNPNQEETESVYRDLFGYYEGDYRVLYIRNKSEDTELSSIRLKSHRLLKRLSVLFSGVFDKGIFMVLKPISREEETQLLLEEKLSFEEDFFYGISKPCHRPSQLSEAFEEALMNTRIADIEGLNSCITEDRGLYDLIISNQHQEVFEVYRRKHLQPLIEYDEANGGALFETVLAFVRHEGMIKATATAMIQHSNTIRYRLSKVRGLLNIEGSDSVLYERLSLAVKLYWLDTIKY